jgi:predicted transcriptional regulator
LPSLTRQSIKNQRSLLNCPLTRTVDTRVRPAYDDLSVLRRLPYAAVSAGTGNAVTDLIFSIAKREVTFFSATALMSFL